MGTLGILPVRAAPNSPDERGADSIFGSDDACRAAVRSDLASLISSQLCHRMGLRVNSRKRAPPPLRTHVGKIVLGGAEPEMRRIHAFAVVAGVTDEEPIRYRPSRDLIGEAMGSHYPAGKGESAVAVVIDAPPPFPTLRRLLQVLSPEIGVGVQGWNSADTSTAGAATEPARCASLLQRMKEPAAILATDGKTSVPPWGSFRGKARARRISVQPIAFCVRATKPTRLHLLRAVRNGANHHART